MAEANLYQEGTKLNHTAVAAVAGGTVIQLPDGRAGVNPSALAAGDIGGFNTEGVYTVDKTASVVFLDGCELYWDHSANAAILRPADGGSDKDFYLGTCVGDAASSATTCRVALNVRPSYIIDLTRDAFVHVPVLTAGTPSLTMVGGAARMAFSATAEAQKLDLLSRRSFPLASNWIADFVVNVDTTCDADVGDLSIGVANGTHASDADSITESAFFHFDLGADLNIDAESDDGTTEVGATDTTIDFVVGTPIRLTLDGRDHTNVKYYINGVERLSATANLGDIQLATGPLKLLCHLEKSSNDSPGIVEILEASVRIIGNE